MSSSDKDTDEASPKSKMKWYTQQFKVELIEGSRSQRLARAGQWGDIVYCICYQVAIRDASKSVLLRHKNSDSYKSSQQCYIH